MRETSLVIIGGPGSGKTTVGTKVAELCNCSLVEVDELIAQSRKQPLGHAFIDMGEEEYRDLESYLLCQELVQLHRQMAVVTCSSGALASAHNRQQLLCSRAVLICLEMDLATAVTRLGLNAPRPAALGSPRLIWQGLAQVYHDYYLQLGGFIVDTSRANALNIAQTIISKVENLSDSA